jgi:hypothetical protein
MVGHVPYGMGRAQVMACSEICFSVAFQTCIVPSFLEGRGSIPAWDNRCLCNRARLGGFLLRRMAGVYPHYGIWDVHKLWLSRGVMRRMAAIA